jgi:hypothetical protein
MPFAFPSESAFTFAGILTVRRLLGFGVLADESDDRCGRKRRLECAGLLSASRSVFDSSPEAMHFYSLISVHVICTIKGPKENLTLVVPNLADQLSKGRLCERFFKTVLRLRKQGRKTGLQAATDGTRGLYAVGMYPEPRRRTARTINIQ